MDELRVLDYKGGGICIIIDSVSLDKYTIFYVKMHEMKQINLMVEKCIKLIEIYRMVILNQKYTFCE